MEERSRPRKRPLLRGLLLGLLVLVAGAVGVFAWLWFGSSPRVPQGPVHMTRGEDGELTPVDPESPAGFWFEAQAGKLEAKNNFGSSTSSVDSGQARFACRSAVVLNRSDHLLMQRVGARLLEHLKKAAYLEKLDYYPASFGPEPGGLAPDAVVALDLVRIDESGPPGRRNLEATIRVTAGNRLARCRSGYSDHLSPPVVEYEFDGRLDHQSTTTGVVSSAAKYKQAADNIAQQIADQLAKLFDDSLKKYGPLPDLPDAFYPPYREPRDFPLAESYNLQALTANHGLMTYNDSFWLLSADKEPVRVLAEIKRRLEEAGWQTKSSSLDEKGIPHVRMAKGSVEVTVFPEDAEAVIPGTQIVVAEDDQEPAGPRPSRLYLHYLDRMTSEEVEQAVDTTLTDRTPVDVVLMFEKQWTGDHRKRSLALLESRHVATPEAWLALARLYRGPKEDDKAVAALRRARLLLRTVPDPGELQSRVKKVAKELGDKAAEDPTLDAALARELGFVELRAGVQVPEIELEPEEPVHVFALTDDGSLKTISLTVVRDEPSAGRPQHQLSHVECAGNSRSWGTGGMDHWADFDGVGRVHFHAEPINGEDRFRLVTEITPKEN